MAESKIRGWLDRLLPVAIGTSSHEMLKRHEMQLRIILIIVVRNMLFLSRSFGVVFQDMPSAEYVANVWIGGLSEANPPHQYYSSSQAQPESFHVKLPACST